MRLTRKTITIASVSFLSVLVLGIITLWLLNASDKVCLARTGITPNEEYFTNTPVFKDAVKRVRDEARETLIREFDSATGFFIYAQHPSGSVVSQNENNDIRQFLAARALAVAIADNESLRALHKQNISAIFANWYKEDGNIGYVLTDRSSKLGANAMFLRVLVASPLFQDYTKEAKNLVRGIVSLENADGSFKPFLKEPVYRYDTDYFLTFYSGEAILALLEYFGKTGDREAYDAAKRAQDFYIDRYVNHLSENYYPAYVPWHTLSIAELYTITGEAKYAEAIFVLNDKLLEIQDTKEFIGRFYNPETPQYGTPHASSDAVYTEGLATAYAVAQKAGDVERMNRYRNALVSAFRNIESLQFKPSPYWIFDNTVVAERLRGGLMTNACSRWIRIDNIAHTIDALGGILKYVE